MIFEKEEFKVNLSKINILKGVWKCDSNYFLK
jgi:hypothetical protein